MILLQIILFLALYTGIIAFAVRDGAINALFFYPKPVQERVLLSVLPTVRTFA